MLILHLRELKVSANIAPHELQFCASFLTLLCKSGFFLQGPQILLSDTIDFPSAPPLLPHTVTLIWTCSTEEDFSEWAGNAASLFYFTTTLSAFLATADRSKLETNQQGF